MGKLADEFIGVLKAVWTTDPAEFHGNIFTLPRSIIRPKPIQKPHPPIYLAAFSPGALRRTARLANGWNPALLPIPVMKQMMDSIKTERGDTGGKVGGAILNFSSRMIIASFRELTRLELRRMKKHLEAKRP